MKVMRHIFAASALLLVHAVETAQFQLGGLARTQAGL